jgi:hypothetical protein
MVKNDSYGTAKKLAAARAGEFSIVDNYKYGYRNREDITNLPPGVLITGSQNVLTNVSERVQIRQGYSVDGAISTVDAPILGCIDWLTRNNAECHMRSGFLTASSSAKVQFRYVDSSGNVSWNDLITGLNSSSFNFTKFWRTDESLRVALGVNGDGNVYEWNGAVATINASTSASITIGGTDTWVNAGFYASTSPRSIVVGSSVFTYTGGENSMILTGVTPDASGITVNALAHQQYIVTAASTFTGPPTTLKPNLISILNNQVYLGSTTNPAMWMSKVNSYKDYSSSTPRQPGEGGTLILDENMTAFVVQGTGTPTASATMYLCAGKDLWYQTTFTPGTDASGNPYETIGACPIKVGPRQGAISQAAVGNMKNYIVMATNETTIDMMGVLENYLTEVQTKNLSDPIKLDIDSYDFTDSSVFYYRYYIYVAVPKEGVVLAYNLTSQTWDPPATIPISRFYIADGELFGHSYNTSESYKLFTGYADRVYPGFLGYPIPANMVFSYETYGTRHALKSATALYVEGYISSNTILNAALTYELDGCATVKNFQLDGSNNKFVCIVRDVGSLGKSSLGKQKLGGSGPASIQGLPPKFRWEPTFTNTDFFENSVSFSCNGTNQQFQLIAFGLNTRMSAQESIAIRN